MTYRLRTPPGPPLPRAAVVLPGHRPQAHSDAYRAGVARYRCTCGAETNPAPPATAAALWREHLEIHMASKTEKLVSNAPPLAHAGRSIYETLWDEMDSVYGRLMAGEGARAKGDKGRAGGLAYALAVMTNPYAPNVEAIRQQAHERWEAGTDDQDQETYAAG